MAFSYLRSEHAMFTINLNYLISHNDDSCNKDLDFRSPTRKPWKPSESPYTVLLRWKLFLDSCSTGGICIVPQNTVDEKNPAPVDR